MKANGRLPNEELEVLVFARPFRKLPVPQWISAAAFAILCYVVFLILAAISGDFNRIVASFMHLLQGFFSVCIFLGLFSASVVNSRFSRTFHRFRVYFDMPDEEYSKIVHSLAQKTNSLGGFVFSIPLMLCATIYFLVVVAPSIPDTMFPVQASSAVFLFVAIVEFSIAMLFLLGNGGYWFTYCMAEALDRFDEFPLKLPALPTRRFLSEMSGFVLTYTVLLTLIIGSVFPVLLAIVVNYSASQYSLWIGGGGLGFVLLTASVLYIIPHVKLHNILVRAKETAIGGLSQEYSKNEARLLEKVKDIKQAGCSEERMQDLEALIKANTYLVERMLFLQSSIREWMIDLSAVTSVVISSIIPIVTFVLQVIGTLID